jgi:hypothetical protein
MSRLEGTEEIHGCEGCRRAQGHMDGGVPWLDPCVRIRWRQQEETVWERRKERKRIKK